MSTEPKSEQELIAQLPEELKFLAEEGYGPSYFAKTKRWYLVKKVGKEVSRELIDHKYDPLMLKWYILRHGKPPKTLQVKEDKRDEEAPKLEGSEIKMDSKPITVPSPEQRAANLLAIQTPPPRVDKEFKPATVFEVEREAWYHNVRESLGEAVYHEAVRRVQLTDEDRADYRRAVSKLLSVVAYIDEDTAKQLLRTEAEMIIAYRLAEEWKKRAKQYEEAWNSLSAVLAQTLCPKCRLAILSHYMMGGAH
jgi:hypothetical protein